MDTLDLIVDEDGFYLWDGSEDQDLQGNRSITKVRVDDTVTAISVNAFNGCINLHEVQLPSGLKQLGDACFFKCASLKRLNLPNSLEKIDRWVFNNSGLEEITIPPLIRRIDAHSVFVECKSLSRVELHENLEFIGVSTFRDCSSLKTIRFPPSLHTIHQSAFDGCGLEQVRLPPNVSVGAWAFRECPRLTEIILPQKMGRLETKAFGCCFNICTIQVPPPTTTTVKETKFTAVEQRIITELCRTDGRSSMDRIGLGWFADVFATKLEPKSTVQPTCLFSFLKRNHIRTSKIDRQGQVGTEKMT